MRENCEHQERVQEMKKYVRYSDGAKMYSMGKTKFQELAKEAQACYKIGQLVVVNTVNAVDKTGWNYSILTIMKATGSIVFDNLALLFAMGVAIGMAKKEKAVAALSGAVGCLCNVSGSASGKEKAGGRTSSLRSTYVDDHLQHR